MNRIFSLKTYHSQQNKNWSTTEKLKLYADEENNEEEKAQKENDNDIDSEKTKSSDVQRAFLSCDLCAEKSTVSYYCPHCLAPYPASYVTLHTRCSRCVSCPVCTSSLEKIVYAGSHFSATKEKEDVYLYQCPFCFWSSNIVGLKASESQGLLENLKEKLDRVVEEKTIIMNDIKQKYLTLNEGLRKEEDRLHKYKNVRSLYSSKDTVHQKKKSSKLSLKTISSIGCSRSALQKMNKAQINKFNKYHVLDKTLCRNIEPPLDQRYVSQFNLQNVSPLQHRLNDPLNQSVEMDKYVPQRFHLMTKESYKCPNTKECGKYVCKPTLRGRQANYDKRTAVLDYLPRIDIELKSGELKTGRKSQIVVMVQNRHFQEAKFKFDASINKNDLYSTAKISCSGDEFEIDPFDIHIKRGTQRNINKPNGDYVKGKEAGVIFDIEPKYYSSGPRDVKFSVKCIFKTKFQLKEEKKSDSNSSLSTSNDEFIDTVLSYILDFELGPPKVTEVTPAFATRLKAKENEDNKQDDRAEDE